MLAGAVTQWSLRGQAHAQHAGAQPVDRRDLGRATILLRVEGVDLQILDHLTLARQAPALLTLLRAQGIGAAIARQSLHALHQAGMATAGATAIRHRHAVLIQGIEQIAARRHRPVAVANA
ncbi:hypothetical protein D3C86_1522780 [compost metagenome]